MLAVETVLLKTGAMGLLQKAAGAHLSRGGALGIVATKLPDPTDHQWDHWLVTAALGRRFGQPVGGNV